jgi:hypothetical protein
MNDLRQSGLRKFVDDFIQELNQDPLLRPGRSDRELEEAVRAKVEATIGDTFRSSLPSPREAIQHFDRVALCTPSWSDVRHLGEHRDAETHLGIVMELVRDVLEGLNEISAVPIVAFARGVGATLGDSFERLQELLELYSSQYDNRANLAHASRRIVQLLDTHAQDSRRTYYLFHPPALRVRCLLWTFFEAVALEAKALRGCATALESFFGSLFDASQGRKKITSFEKGITLLFIPHILVWRATLVVVSDIITGLSTPKLPPPILGVLFHLLRDSKGLCLAYTLDGHLQNHNLEVPPTPFFKTKRGGLASESLRTKWMDDCRSYAESVMRAEGGNLGIDAAATPSWKFEGELLSRGNLNDFLT